MSAKVVLVEDDAELCSVLRHALQDVGCDVRAFCNANEAWDGVRSREEFDLLISDLSFPKGQTNGLSLSLNAIRHHRAMSVIYITARDDLAEIARQGGHPVLLKPFSLVTFLQKVQTVLECRRAAALPLPPTAPAGHPPVPLAP